jgi:hypothetical protein
MTYEIGKLPLETLLPAMTRAEDQLARLDEIVRRSPVREGFVERGHFFDAAASMWVAGELVHIEDLVLHDARMDVRAPTHELTIAHGQLRTRRRIAFAQPDWATSEAGVAALSGSVTEQPAPPIAPAKKALKDNDASDDDPLAREFASIDAILERSQSLLDRIADGALPPRPERKALVVGDLMIRDPEWDEGERLFQWREVMKCIEDLPATLAAAILHDAWESLEPIQNLHWLGGHLISAYLRYRSKVTSHVPAFHVGLKAIPRERRRARQREQRLLASLDAMSAGAEVGMKEISRLSQARDQMERHLRGRRCSSSLPAVIELVLSRPIVSARMIAKTAKVTQRGALNLIGELGVREITGRGRYRAWGVL